MRDLDEVAPGTPINEIPFTITESGFYYLTRSMSMSSSAHAIDVQASHVTIDLMGFTLDGANIGQRGIYMSGYEDIEIRNGSLIQFTSDGIQVAQGGLDLGVRIIGVRVEDTPVGIGLDGAFHLIRDCMIRNVSFRGIWIQSSSQVLRNNIFVQDNAIGILSQINNQIIGNSVTAGTGPGTSIGIAAADRENAVRDNHIKGGGEAAIKVTGPGNTIEGNQTQSFTHCILFTVDGSFFANNRCAGSAGSAFELGSTDQRDGGGNWDGTVP